MRSFSLVGLEARYMLLGCWGRCFLLVLRLRFGRGRRRRSGGQWGWHLQLQSAVGQLGGVIGPRILIQVETCDWWLKGFSCCLCGRLGGLFLV